MNFFNSDETTALEAKEKAQWISFAPFIFQAAKALRDFGILQAIEEKLNTGGINLKDIETKCKIDHYTARVLTEAGLGAEILIEKEGKYFLTKTGYYLLTDKLTRVNMDFTHDVCYEGLFLLEDSLKNGKPEGLKHFGKWNTVYEALAHLPAQVQKSWFGFDHFYSDNVFKDVLPLVFAHQPKSLLDIGGNTGKWALQCFQYDKEVKVTIMDLPGQTAMAEKNIASQGFSERILFYPNNVLEEKNPFPVGFDAIWMSQFLDCFSDEQIISILSRCKAALNKNGSVFILEPLWDLQKFPSSAMSLQMTSLYFTAIANGNSQMYRSEVFFALIEKAGLKVENYHPGIGVSQTLIQCKIK